MQLLAAISASLRRSNDAASHEDRRSESVAAVRRLTVSRLQLPTSGTAAWPHASTALTSKVRRQSV